MYHCVSPTWVHQEVKSTGMQAIESIADRLLAFPPNIKQPLKHLKRWTILPAYTIQGYIASRSTKDHNEGCLIGLLPQCKLNPVREERLGGGLEMREMVLRMWWIGERCGVHSGLHIRYLSLRDLNASCSRRKSITFDQYVSSRTLYNELVTLPLYRSDPWTWIGRQVIWKVETVSFGTFALMVRGRSYCCVRPET